MGVFKTGAGTAAAALVALACWCPAVAQTDSGAIRLATPRPSAAAADSGVIRLPEPRPRGVDMPPSDRAIDPLREGRRGFDVEAFDGRLDGLWFQRKIYAREGRIDDAARQAKMIRAFVAEEGVRRLEVPAGALVLEAETYLREGNAERALAALSLAETLDPGRPQTAVARARATWASSAGIFATAAEWLRAARAAARLAVRDLTLAHESALLAVAASLALVALFALFMLVRYQIALRHDVEEWLASRGHETLSKAGGWAVLLAPLLTWFAAGWAGIYWIAVLFRYMRRAEKTLAVALLAVTAVMVPAYRFAVGLYGLAADPTVRTTIEAANGGYDPDRIVKLRALVDAHPEDPMYRFLLAGLYKNGRYFEEAFEEYKRVLDAAPSTYQARINLGNIYFLIGQYGEAIAQYRKALEVRPDSVLAYYDTYLAQSESFKLKEAAASLERARQIDAEEANRLLTRGSNASGGPKVVDAAIDFGSIWRVTVEGRHLREWLDASPRKTGLASIARDATNPLTIAALLGLLAAAILALAFHGRPGAQACARCGRPFCPSCRPGRDGHPYCSQCLHLFVLGDGLAPETKSMKLYEIERHETWGLRLRRAASVLVPGASHLLEGRAWLGATLVLLWVSAWIGGFPEILGPLEHAMGFPVHLAALRPAPVPAVDGLDAAALLAVPLGAAVWIAGNVGFRHLRKV